MTTKPDLSFYLDETDELAEMVAERTAKNPAYPALLREAKARRAFLHGLAEERKRLNVSQTEIARRMGTSQPFISRLERGSMDPQHGTEDRYAAALGLKIERRLVSGG